MSGVLSIRTFVPLTGVKPEQGLRGCCTHSDHPSCSRNAEQHRQSLFAPAPCPSCRRCAGAERHFFHKRPLTPGSLPRRIFRCRAAPLFPNQHQLVSPYCNCPRENRIPTCLKHGAVCLLHPLVGCDALTS